MPTPAVDRIAELVVLERTALQQRWEEAFGRPPPRRISRDLLIRTLAYRIQEEAEGGLSKAAQKRLTALASTNKDEGHHKPVARRLTPGTRLVREWRGDTHQVTVLDDGFEHRGKRYASLSHIAREITGTRWSGPRFFGVH